MFVGINSDWEEILVSDDLNISRLTDSRKAFSSIGYTSLKRVEVGIFIEKR